MRQQEGDLMGDKETWWWNDEVKDAIRAKNQQEVGYTRKTKTATGKQTRRQRKKYARPRGQARCTCYLSIGCTYFGTILSRLFIADVAYVAVRCSCVVGPHSVLCIFG